MAKKLKANPRIPIKPNTDDAAVYPHSGIAAFDGGADIEIE